MTLMALCVSASGQHAPVPCAYRPLHGVEAMLYSQCEAVSAFNKRVLVSVPT